MDLNQMIAERLASFCLELENEKKLLDPYVQSAIRSYIRIEREINDNPVVEKYMAYGRRKPNLFPLNVNWFPWSIDLATCNIVVTLNDPAYEDVVLEIGYVLNLQNSQELYKQQRLRDLEDLLQKDKQETLDHERRLYLRAKEIVKEYERVNGIT